MSKKLAKIIKESWIEAENAINKMTEEDFAITYDKSTNYEDIPLFRAIRSQNAHLAELIINKNPIFAAKIVDDLGFTGLHHICCCLNPTDALKIANLLIPHMTKESIVSKDLAKETFLDFAISHNHYRLAGFISPELLIIMLDKNNNLSYQPGKFLYDAAHVFNVDISLRPEVADNYFRKGNILYAIGKKEKAIKSYNKAIELDSNYIEKIVFNMKELFTYSNNEDQTALQFLNNITHPNLDLPIQNTKELIKIRNTQFIEKIGQLKRQSIEITKNLFTVEKDYHEFLQDLETAVFSGEHTMHTTDLLGAENITNVHNDSI
jgi:tetratricopeptide (TPR) repeat protein